MLGIIGSVTGLVILWITVELRLQVPGFKMPLPSGPHAAGTLTFLLVDESRIHDESAAENGFRTMSVQAWYPPELVNICSLQRFKWPGSRPAPLKRHEVRSRHVKIQFDFEVWFCHGHRVMSEQDRQLQQVAARYGT